jgi:hypothetical protein
MFKYRIHAALIAFDKPCAVSDLLGSAGRRLLERVELPEPWRTDVTTALAEIDDLDVRIDACTEELTARGADHPDVALLQSVPGVAWCLASRSPPRLATSAASASAKTLVGYTGLCLASLSPPTTTKPGALAANGP